MQCLLTLFPSFLGLCCSVKKVALRLIETMVDKCEDPDMVAAQVGSGEGVACAPWYLPARWSASSLVNAAFGRWSMLLTPVSRAGLCSTCRQ